MKKYTITIGTFYFYENMVIAEMNGNQNVGFHESEKLFELCTTHFGKDTPFVYISNRINSYSLEPTAHFKSTKLFPNVKGYGIITYNPIGNKIAQIERPFMDKPFEIFHNLEDAIKWVEKIISKE